MARAAQFHGVDRLIAKIKREKVKKAKQFSIGLREAAVELQRLSLPLVPVWQGPLRASAEVRVSGKGFATIVLMLYGTEYAIYVHEIMPPDVTHGAQFNAKHAAKIKRIAKSRKKAKLGKHTYWFNRGPRQQAKFLEQPFRENRKELLQIILDELRS